MDNWLIISSLLLWLMTLINLIISMAIIRRISNWSLKNSTIKSSESKVIDLLPGEQAQPFSAENLNGEIVTLSSFNGRMFILIFIMTHCGACRAGIPSYLDIAHHASKKGIELILVNIDEKAATSALAKEFNISIPLLVAPKRNSFEIDYKVKGTPSYCLIDKQGRIKSAGFMSELNQILDLL